MSEAFDRFWTLYPRKVAKGTARRAWVRAVKVAGAEVIVGALEAQVAGGVFRVEKCFVPHPATWLNGERWEDDVAGGAKGGGEDYGF